VSVAREAGAPADGATTRVRALALAGVAALTLSYASVLYHVADVTRGAETMLAVLAGSLVLGVVLGRYVGATTAGVVALGVAVAGFAGYVLSVPPDQRALLFTPQVLADTVALLTGLSVLRLTNAGVWALGVAPAPVLVSWYLAVRRRYVWSVVAGGAALSLLVLTGDAGPTTTLAGVVGGAVAVGVGEAERTGGLSPQFDAVVAVVAAMVVVTASLSAAAGGGAGAAFGSGVGSPTVESTVVEAQDNVRILGSISLSPDARFEVSAERGDYWQTAAYDRYTGQGWVRTGETTPVEQTRAGPPGAARPLRQEVTARTTLGSVPAAWRPVDVEGVEALATPQGGFRPETSVPANTTYTVRSRVPQHTTAQLRRAGTDYPEDVEATYTGLPGSTPDRVRERAAEVTANASTPYDKAVAVERYLEEEKRYSLDVEDPDGSIADSFLFEMEAGYCTYYATTMVAMLRSQGVPARFVVGYTSGERVGDDRYLVRGLDSHAWVQVYFPDVGWVRFDPTPAGPREAAEQRQIREAQSNATGVDGNASDPALGSDTDVVNLTPTTPVPDPNVTAATGNETATPMTPPPGDTDGGLSLPELPSTRTLTVWAVALAGLLAVGRRTGALSRARTAVALRRQSRSTPDADAIRAYDRLETLFERRHRPRAPGETPRAYVASLVAGGADEAALSVVDAYERARHGDGVDEATADDAVATVDRLVAERSLVGRHGE
jgi:transglutaminase-like putative cysteine protease